MPAIYVHVLREMYKRRRLFKRSERLRRARVLEILSTSTDPSSSDSYDIFLASFSSILAHEVTPARAVDLKF